MQAHLVGVFNGEGPPVPIPNTAVKLTSADNTCLETDREDRSTPTQSSREILGSFFTVFYSASEVLDAGKREKSLYMTRQNEGSEAAGYAGKRQSELVPLAVRVHPFPFRTRKLSSLVPTILGW